MSRYRPLQAGQDAGKGYVPPERPLAFAADWEAIPVSSGELMRLVGWYPVGFQRRGDTYQLALPARAGERRALINPITGRWFGHQLPLALRLYPLRLVAVLGEDGTPGEPVLALDTEAEAHFTTAAPQPLLDHQGQWTEVGRKRVQALQRYQQRQARDQQVIQRLAERGLFIPWELNLGSEEVPARMADWYQLDVTRLGELTPQDAADLHALGGWRLVYGHQYSQLRAGAPARLAERLAQRQAAQQNEALDGLFGGQGDDIAFDFDFD